MRALLILCMILAPLVARADSAVVFMYHRFGEDRFPATNVRLDAFEQQLAMLAKPEFTVIPLRQLLDHLDGTGDLPPGAVVLTIDDAYLSVHDEAWPRLQAAGFPFTVFVATDPVDKQFAGTMSWEQMRTMAADGVTFANHGAAHAYLVRREVGESDAAWLARVRTDLEQGARRLEEELGASGGLLRDVFAYPYGEYTEGVAEVAQALGYRAFGQQSGALDRSSDARALPRYPINEAYSDLREFRTKARSLPLPVTAIEPWDPVTGRHARLTLRLSSGVPTGLACYVSGQGRTEPTRLEDGQSVRIVPAEPLGRGRQRVNCTAPGPDGRYYWYSHQWIVQ